MLKTTTAPTAHQKPSNLLTTRYNVFCRAQSLSNARPTYVSRNYSLLDIISPITY